MPTYTFICSEGHETDRRMGYSETDMIVCPECGQPAEREAVYYDQHIIGETCAKPYRRADVPRDEKSFHHTFRRANEAGQEIAYEIQKRERETGTAIKQPSLYKQALARAKEVQSGIKQPLFERDHA